MKKSLLVLLLLMSLCVLVQVDVEQRGNSPNAYVLTLDCTPLSISTPIINQDGTFTIQQPFITSFFDVGLVGLRRATS